MQKSSSFKWLKKTPDATIASLAVCIKIIVFNTNPSFWIQIHQFKYKSLPIFDLFTVHDHPLWPVTGFEHELVEVNISKSDAERGRSLVRIAKISWVAPIHICPAELVVCGMPGVALLDSPDEHPAGTDCRLRDVYSQDVSTIRGKVKVNWGNGPEAAPDRCMRFIWTSQWKPTMSILGQLHVYETLYLLATQVPPFWQGLTLHGFV